MFDKYHPGYFGKVCVHRADNRRSSPANSPPPFSSWPRADIGGEPVAANLTRGTCLPGSVWYQVGMRYFNKRTNKYFNPIINLDKLWTLVGEEVRHRTLQLVST